MGLFFRGPPGNTQNDTGFGALLGQAGLLPDPQPMFGALSFPPNYTWEAPDGTDPKAIRQAVLKGLFLLNPGQDESGNVRAFTNDFAGVADPSAISTTNWHPSWSLHSSRTLESPPLPGYPGYVLKMYDDPRLGNTIAATYPTRDFTQPAATMAHFLHAIPDYLGYPQNPGIARDFLNASTTKDAGSGR